jgi:hypothetical protein
VQEGKLRLLNPPFEGYSRPVLVWWWVLSFLEFFRNPFTVFLEKSSIKNPSQEKLRKDYFNSKKRD